ncbi:MAG: hypothetical protein KC493_15875 [Bacteriovoracaceae bacterium]|nr:hypothetical protein [Bacteriovoracaceae bacterium]
MKRLLIIFLFLLCQATSFASDTKPNHKEENSDDDNVTTDRGQYVDSSWDKEDKRDDSEAEDVNDEEESEDEEDSEQDKDQYVDSGWDESDKKEKSNDEDSSKDSKQEDSEY